MEEKTHNEHEKHIPEEARKHFEVAGEELRKAWEGMFPPGTVEHRRNAGREMLLAFRSLLDAAIDKMEKPEEPS